MENTLTENSQQELSPSVEETVQNYQQRVRVFIEFCERLKSEAAALQEEHQEKLESVDAGLSNAFRKIEEDYEQVQQEEVLLMEELMGEISSYQTLLQQQGELPEEKALKLSKLKAVVETAFNSKVKEAEQLFMENKEQLDAVPEQMKATFLEEREEQLAVLLAQYGEETYEFLAEENELLSQHYETAGTIAEVDATKSPSKSPQSYLNVGRSIFCFELSEFQHEIPFHHFVPFVHKKNILLTNSTSSDEEATVIINCMIARALISYRPGNATLHLVDPVNRGRSFRKFARLSPTVKQVYAEEKEIDKLFKELDQSITRIFQTVLNDEYNDIGDYNRSSEETEPYHLIVIRNFPTNLSKKSIKRLRGIIENGPIAGINVIVVAEDRGLNPKSKKSKEDQLEGLASFFTKINLSKHSIKDSFDVNPVIFCTEEDINVSAIIDHINEQVEA